MSLTDLNADYQAVLEAEARRHPGIERDLLKVGVDIFNKQIGSGSPRAQQFAIEKAITGMRSCAKKSEADAVAAATSRDFDIGPATQGQRAAAATEALQLLGLRRALTQRVQAMNPELGPDEIEAVVNVAVIRYEGGNGITVDNSNPQVAASLRERDRNDGTIWEIDLASPRQQDAVDEQMAANAVASNFEGLRNLGYAATRSAAPSSTNFSGSTGAAPPVASPGTTAEPSTLPAASIQAIAQAAYAAGVAAASSNFAKRGRRGR